MIENVMIGGLVKEKDGDSPFLATNFSRFNEFLAVLAIMLRCGTGGSVQQTLVSPHSGDGKAMLTFNERL